MDTAQTGIFPWSGAKESPFHKGLVRPLLLLSQVTYVLFLSAGHFKENLSWLPFDLTLATTVVLLVLSFLSFLADGGKIPYVAVWLALFFILMSFSCLWTEWTPYAVEKTSRFFTITMLGWLVPLMVVKDLKAIRRLVWMLIVLGMVLSSSVIWQVTHGGFTGDIGERTTGLTSVTIALGIDAGQALVALYALVLQGGKWVWMSAVCFPLFITLVASGSRGPLFVAVLVLALMTLRFSRFSSVNLWILIGLIAIALVSFSDFASLLPQGSVRRIEEVLQGAEDQSSNARKEANLAALEAVLPNPQGLGFGGFAKVYNFGRKTDRIYPHNVFVEITVENGILAGSFFLAITFFSLRRTYRAAVENPALRPLLAVFLFTIGQSMVSGEININRLLYGLIMIGFMLPAILHREQAEMYAPAQGLVAL